MEITRYKSDVQDIILEKDEDIIRLTIDDDLQFDSREDSIYSEAMSQYAIALMKKKEKYKVLILGGGDGLIAKEFINEENLGKILICDFDKTVVDICKKDPEIRKLNRDILNSEKVSIHYEDAFTFIENVGEKYDVIIADFPDVHTIETTHLFSQEFYRNIGKILSPDGIFITIACEIHHTRRAFLSILKSLKIELPFLFPYSVTMPHTYGEIGIIVASNMELKDIKCSIEKRVKINEGELNMIIENTRANSIAHTYFIEDTALSGFIPGVTNNYV